MTNFKSALTAIVLISASSTAYAGGYETAYADPVVTAPAGVAGISVRTCSDEPGLRRNCHDGDRRRVSVTRSAPPPSDKPEDKPTDTSSEEPKDHASSDCPSCDEWRTEYERKKAEKPWLNNPKWSADKPFKKRERTGKSMWEKCIGDKRAAQKEAHDDRS